MAGTFTYRASHVLFWRSTPKRISNQRDRVGGGVTSPVLSHHRTYGSVYGGSWLTLKPGHRIQQAYQRQAVEYPFR
ncbi:hypothetical protein DYI41_02510 [Marinobacter salarius]|nr:hypothetical protein [Marinobacter salarius]